MNLHLTQTASTYCSTGYEAVQRCLIDEIGKAIDVVGGLDDLTYRRDSTTSSSVGEQFRHNLDFLNTFLNGIDRGAEAAL